MKVLAYKTLRDIARSAFLSAGCKTDDAALLATICTDNSCALDAMVAAISGGKCTAEIPVPEEDAVSQAFLAFKVDASEVTDLVNRSAEPLHEEGHRYPGEGAASVYEARMKEGLPIQEDLLAQLILDGEVEP